jgi:hypothetical protein
MQPYGLEYLQKNVVNKHTIKLQKNAKGEGMTVAAFINTATFAVGVMAKSYNNEKSQFSINHSILSGGFCGW